MHALIDQSIAKQFDRLPPHSIEAEMCLLSSMALDTDMLDRCASIVDRDAMYQVDHQMIFDVLTDMRRRRVPIDILTLRDELGRRQMLEEIGGQGYLAQIINTMPTAAHGEQYARIVAEKGKLRNLIAIANDALRAAYAPMDEDGADEMLIRFARKAESIIDTGTSETIRTVADVVDQLLEEKDAGEVTRMPTGLLDLDEITGGFPIGGYTIIAADGGIGKSQLCKQIVRNNAANGVPCGIVAAEESAAKIVSNYLAGLTGIENSRIVRNQLSAADWSRLWGAKPKLSKLPIFIDDAQRKLSRVESCIRSMVKRHGCRMIVVDHLHLLDGEATKNQNRTQEVDKISKSLKATFKELNVVGIAAAQVNRTGSPDEPPTLTQLRDSGSLVADADVILQLKRDDWHQWRKVINFQPNHKLEVFVNKNKDGPMGSRDFYFDGDSQTITDWNNGAGPNGHADMF